MRVPIQTLSIEPAGALVDFTLVSLMLFDLENPVVQFCAAGMEVDGEPSKALALFERAWASRRDDFDASVAAHYVARHQATPQASLEWNERALQHAEAIADDRAASLMPSLCLNLAESYRKSARMAEAEQLALRGLLAVDRLPPDDGYARFVRAGLDRLLQRLRAGR
ncbi:MAG TPA: hypothetical protein VK636_09705 [Gemmatimonadaceae bacterium]|nr:hypothetical protein [Gemmatimonadaceae bacterium]